MFDDLTRWTKEGLIQKVKRLEKEVVEWQWKYYEAKGLIEVEDETESNTTNEPTDISV